MPRSIALLLALATSAAAVQAQSAGADAPGTSPDVQTQPAPVVRAYPGGYGPGMQDAPSVSQVTQSYPIPGVLLRVAPDGSVQTVSADAKGTELRVERGRANISVRQPAHDSELLVDLPGGQVSLLKDGLYTFNADTKTVRVLKGEADAYPGGASPGVKGIKVKEGREVAFAAASGGIRAVEVDPRQLWADVLPQSGGNGEPPRGPGYGYPGYGYGPYGDGYYGYPYAVYPGYAWGYPGWGYPYGFGYGFGVGFGYYGGFRGGYAYRGYRR
jgi:hypothetical protein